MKCPNCGNSLWFTKDICPFCKTALASEASHASTSGTAVDPNDGEGLVALTQCETLAEADAIRAQLESAGINAFLPDEALMQTIAWNVNTYGFIRIQVPSRDYEAARQLLSAAKEDRINIPSDDAEMTVPLNQVPLSWPMRWFAFGIPLLTCPAVFIFAVAKSGYTRQGCDRKAKELWHWFAGGIAFWVLVFIVIAIIDGRRTH